jgi:hypothetical protein
MRAHNLYPHMQTHGEGPPCSHWILMNERRRLEARQSVGESSHMQGLFQPTQWIKLD